MTVITLDDWEVVACRIIGLLRHQSNLSSGVKDNKKDSRGGEEIHMDGFMAEYAFGKWKNLHVDLSTKSRSGGYDLRDKNFRFDIKTSRYADPYLKVRRPNPDVDIYILSSIKGNDVTFHGWCEKDLIINDENLVDYGNGPHYSLKKEKLKKL